MSGKIDFKEVVSAIDAGDSGKLEAYLNSNFMIDRFHEAGWSLLTIAVNARNHHAQKLLIEHGASPRCRDNIGFNSIDHAIDNRDFRTAEVLKHHSEAVQFVRRIGHYAQVAFGRLAIA